MQREGMEGSGGNILRVQTFLDALVHLLRSLAAKRQQQNLIGRRFAGVRSQPARATSTDVLPLPAPASTSSECSPLTTARAWAGLSGEDSTVLKKSAYC
jgi:hypothetical protein